MSERKVRRRENPPETLSLTSLRLLWCLGLGPSGQAAGRPTPRACTLAPSGGRHTPGAKAELLPGHKSSPLSSPDQWKQKAAESQQKC